MQNNEKISSKSIAYKSITKGGQDFFRSTLNLQSAPRVSTEYPLGVIPTDRAV